MGEKKDRTFQKREKYLPGSCCGRELSHIWNRGKTKEGVDVVGGDGDGCIGGQGLP